MNEVEELVYVNINGDVVDTKKPVEKEVKPKPVPQSYHRGWRVKGIEPGRLESARMEARLRGEDFDDKNWLMNAKKTPLRSKPYELYEAAETCKRIAEKAGWLRVIIEEVKKEVTEYLEKKPFARNEYEQSWLNQYREAEPEERAKAEVTAPRIFGMARAEELVKEAKGTK